MAKCFVIDLVVSAVDSDRGRHIDTGRWHIDLSRRRKDLGRRRGDGGHSYTGL